MRDCFSVLAAPGVPIELPLRTPGGVIELRATSYSLAIVRGVVRITRPRLFDPSGNLLASAEDVFVSGLSVQHGSDQVVRVTVSDLYGRLTRLKNGRFQLQNLVPQKSGKTNEVPYSVEVRRASVDVIDEEGPRPFSLHANSQHVQVIGLGSDWTATGNVALTGLGTAATVIHRSQEEGFRLDLVAHSLELATVLDHLKQTPDVKRVGGFAEAGASSVILDGPVTVQVSNKNQVAFGSHPRVRVANLRYRQYVAERAVFKGDLTQYGAQGHVDAFEGPSSATFDGGIRWDSKLRLGLRFEARAANRGSLPPYALSLLPKEIAFSRASARGWVGYSDRNTYSVQGDLVSDTVSFSNWDAAAVRSTFYIGPSSAAIHVNTANVNGQGVSGGIVEDLRDNTIQGGVRLRNLNLEAVAARYHLLPIRGAATVDALIIGTSSHPEVVFETSGRVRYLPKGLLLEPADFEVNGSFRQGAIKIDRASLASRQGNAIVLGTVSADGSLAFHVAGRQFVVQAFTDRLTGQANVEADVGGTVEEPVIIGRGEAYAVKAQDREIPLVTTDFVADKQSIRFNHLRAIQGAAQADGSGMYLFATRHLSGTGSATGLQIADFLSGNFAGVVDLTNISIVGSASAPLVTGELVGDSLVLNGVKVDHAELHASADRNGLNLDSANVQLAGGNVSATGDYDFGTKVARVKASSTPLNLSDLSGSYLPEVSVSGTVSGKASLELEGNKIHAAFASGRLKGLAVNETLVGDGSWSLTGSGTQVDGSIEAGQLDRFISLTGLHFDYGPDRPTLQGEADLYNLSAEDLVTTGLKFFPNLSYDSFNALKSVQGSVNALVRVSGLCRDPEIDVTALDATHLSILGEPLGKLTSAFSRKAHVWDIDAFKLDGGPGTLTLKGSVAEHGDVRLDGDLSGLVLAKLGAVEPALSSVNGEANASFTVAGPVEKPKIVASVSGSGLFKDPAGGSEDRSLRVELAPVTISESETLKDGTVVGGVDLSGEYFYRGFLGQITAHAPLKYPMEIPDDQAVRAHLTVANRQLPEIGSIFGGIDVKRTEGTVGGAVDVTGTIKSLAAKGALNVASSQFAVEGVDNLFTDLRLDMNVEGDTIKVSAHAKGSSGGSIAANVSTQQGDLSTAVTKLTNGGLDALLSDAFSGRVQAQGLKLRQGYAQRTYVQGVVSGDVALGGTFRRPTIAGAVNISGLTTVVPPFEPKEAPAKALSIIPSFDVNVQLEDQARVMISAGDVSQFTATSAELFLTGGGSLKGTLALPEIESSFAVEKGQLRLPAALIRLENSGKVAFSYRTTRSDTVARLDVDLTGDTQLTVPSGGDTITRHDINLVVRGDLLSADGLNLSATSDPPDLTQDRILAMLGQTDVLENLNPGSGVSRSEAQRQVQSALAGFALPGLVTPITSSIAKTLGLDYLEVGINPYQEASFSFAKALGSDLTFQGSRGLSQPPPGYPFQYDYRLNLHPRRFGGLLQRFSLFLGTDQNNPYKFGLVYGSRF